MTWDTAAAVLMTLANDNNVAVFTDDLGVWLKVGGPDGDYCQARLGVDEAVVLATHLLRARNLMVEGVG